MTAAERALAALASLAAAAAAAGCGEEPAVVRPLIEAPPEDSDAFPYDGLDELELSVARPGDDAALVSATVPAGEPLSLSGVPFEEEVVIHLSGRAAGNEVAYGRTCTLTSGAVYAPPDEREPRLYFSRIVKWGPAPPPHAGPRVAALAYRMPDGRALFAGGVGETSMERFDPLETGAFTALGGDDLMPRRGGVLAAFGDGRALIVGGVDEDGDAIRTAEVIDPRPGTAEARQLEQHDGLSLAGHAAVALVDGAIAAVAGGRSQSAAGQPFLVTSAAFLFRFGPGDVLDAPAALPDTMELARADHTMTRLGDEVGADVLIVGGRDAAGLPVAQAELYRPLREAFELVDGALLAVPRWGHIAVVRLPGGFVLIVGGLAPDPLGGEPVPVAELELYDPVQGQFTSAGALPASAGLTELTATPLPDGRVLLAGGRDATGAAVDTASIVRLDPLSGLVDIVATDRLAVPRAGHAAVSLCDGTVLVVGGTDETGAAAERYNPPSAGRR